MRRIYIIYQKYGETNFKHDWQKTNFTHDFWNELYTRFLERTLHTIFCELKNVCKVRSLRKLNFKTGIVFYWNFISILVIKLNVLCKLKKRQKYWQWLLLKWIQI